MRRLTAFSFFGLFFSVTVLSLFGIVMLYSTTAAMYGEQMLKRQLLWIFLGVVAALMFHRIDYRRIGKASKWILLGVILPLLYLASVHIMARSGVSQDLLNSLPFVREVNGAYRWLFIFGRSVQPSEFARLAIIIYLAHYYGGNPRYLNSFMFGLVRPMAVVGAVIVLVLLGGSLSVTAITCFVVVGLLFVAGVRLRYFLLLLVAGLTMVTVVLKHSPERISRIVSYQDPEKYKEKEGYQLWSSQLALGSGAWRGVGFNQSRMKEYYLPEAHTDFIMAIVGEELGYVAVVMVILLYMLLLFCTFAISAASGDREGMLLGFGIGLGLGIAAFINISVVSGFLPTTGISAPLISYGGSGMLVTWIGVGIVSNIARQATASAEEEPPLAERLGSISWTGGVLTRAE